MFNFNIVERKLTECSNFSNLPFFPSFTKYAISIGIIYKYMCISPLFGINCTIYKQIFKKLQLLRTSSPEMFYKIHAFFISNTFIGNARIKLAKNQANAKEHPEAELWLFENYSYSSSTLSSKNDRTYSKKMSKRTSVSVFLRLYD